MSIGERMKLKRKFLHLSQEQLALKLSVSPSTIGAWERGTREINANQLASICKALRCSASFLIGLEEAKPEDLSIQRKIDIVRFGANDWAGDKDALWEFALLYMCLPIDKRRDIAGYGIHLYENELKSGNIKCKTTPDLGYLETAWENLYK